jgi:pentatricopeptide repeat protein
MEHKWNTCRVSGWLHGTYVKHIPGVITSTEPCFDDCKIQTRVVKSGIQPYSEVLKRMQDAGEQPDTAAYNAAVHAWCVNDRPEQAEALVERMIRESVKPNAATYPEIVHAWARAVGAVYRLN